MWQEQVGQQRAPSSLATLRSPGLDLKLDFLFFSFRLLFQVRGYILGFVTWVDFVLLGFGVQVVLSSRWRAQYLTGSFSTLTHLPPSTLNYTLVSEIGLLKLLVKLCQSGGQKRRKDIATNLKVCFLWAYKPYVLGKPSFIFSHIQQKVHLLFLLPSIRGYPMRKEGRDGHGWCCLLPGASGNWEQVEAPPAAELAGREPHAP